MALDSAPGTGFTLQSSSDMLWWLCLVIIIGLAVAIVYVIYRLGALPGEVAHRRGHPQAAAISVSGWLGLLFPPLWPVALIWAYINPAGRDLHPVPDLNEIEATLKGVTAKVTQIERELQRATQ